MFRVSALCWLFLAATASCVLPSTSLASPPLGVSVSGNGLVDAGGAPLVLRGVNASGLEFVAIEGYDPGDPWGGQEPIWSAITKWEADTVRLPLNEASWLGLTTIDTSGNTRKGDPGGNYRQTVENTVAAANAAGLYVILDLHWGAPGLSSPMMQTQMADADNSLNFWTSIASTFKSNPAVLFELYNEPWFYSGLAKGEDQWKVMMQGGVLSAFPATDGSNNYQTVYIVQLSGASGAFIPGETATEGAASAVVNHWESASGRLFIEARPGGTLHKSPFTNGGVITGKTSGASGTVANASLGWNVASMQAMINAVRDAGATNVVLIGGVNYNNDLSEWLANRPSDPINQLAATWHPYPPEDFVSGASIAASGSHYAVNDTITLPHPETAYQPAQLTVTGVGAGGALTGVSISQIGEYLETTLPKNPVPQGSTSGSGSGASFDLSFQNESGAWSIPANWPTVLSIAAGVPVLITETGEYNAPGTKGAPFLHQLLPWADTHHISYLGWTWDVWSNPENVLITSAKGAPTDGYGQYFRSHLISLQGP
jgi:hypothetical protein